MTRWALVDRDGTIIVNHPYLTDAARVELVPGAAEALRILRGAGLAIGVLTNQSAIGRGLLDEAGLTRIHHRMTDLLAAEGARVDIIVHCPHDAEAGCTCRKPRVGLVDQIAAGRPLDRAKSFVIGDDRKDIELGRAIGAQTFLVRTGHGRMFEAEGVPAHFVVDDLLAAARAIIDVWR